MVLICSQSTHQPVLDGTWCDVGKWCIEGNCIQNGTLPATPEKPRCDCELLLILRLKCSLTGCKLFLGITLYIYEGCVQMP